jgi:exonuclease SbcC
MIPQRVKLKGFLCYKDEQDIDFDGNSTLWMLSGLNGSGKSSIFDAVTFALFGHHRGGGQHNQELINKDSDGLLVEFDFLLDGKGYRAKRTLKRDTRGGARGTQQLFRNEFGANGSGQWKPLEDTGSREGYNKWISDNIGLNYETFTSSVLLLQGKAENLLGSKPEDRRKVLASIVDLERFERLHEKADAKRKALKSKLEGLSDRLKALPEVKPEQEQAAEDAIRTAEQAREQARAEVEHLHEVKRQAKSWRELQSKLAAARQRWQDAEQLLEKAADIERDLARLRELREVLPRLFEIANCRVEIRNAQTRIEGLNKDRRKAEEMLTERTAALEQTRNKRVSIRNLLESEEAKLQKVREQLDVAKLHMDRLQQHELQESELARVREALTRLPAHPEQQVIQAREKCTQLAEIHRVTPLLERLARLRDDLRKAVRRGTEALREVEEIKVRGNKHKAELERLAPVVEEAKQLLQRARDEATEVRTLVKQAWDSLAEADQLEGAARCRHCGQKILPGHIEDEKRKRSELLGQIQSREEQAKEALRQAQEKEKQLRSEHASAEKDRNDARVEFEQARGRLNQAKQEIEGLRGECARTYEELSDEHRHRISAAPPQDWLTTTYPDAADLQALRLEASQLPGAQQGLTKAEDARGEWTKLKAKETAYLEQMHRLARELPEDREAVRKTYTRLDVDARAHKKDLESYKANLESVEKELDQLAREREQADSKVRDCETQVQNQESAQEHAQNSMRKQMKALPAGWQLLAQEVGLTEVHRLESEKADLEQKRTDEKEGKLQQARANRDVYRKDVEDYERRQQEFAEQARRDPDEIEQELNRAEQTESRRDKDLTQVRQQLARLEDYQSQREQIGTEYIRLEGEHSQCETLAKLLGKDHLQLYLVRQAERQVVEYANAVVDRLSGGQLYLKLRGEAEGEGNSGKALELEAYNRVTGEKPINVAFLSGSQKFRVAVSLALGIGQYASRQHRPIESVIIDEGFGCLDSQGRQVMIQELQNLRSQMRCILLVSHQEEFAEAFSDGYHFELEAGATRVKRFQK